MAEEVMPEVKEKEAEELKRRADEKRLMAKQLAVSFCFTIMRVASTVHLGEVQDYGRGTVMQCSNESHACII